MSSFLLYGQQPLTVLTVLFLSLSDAVTEFRASQNFLLMNTAKPWTKYFYYYSYLYILKSFVLAVLNDIAIVKTFFFFLKIIMKPKPEIFLMTLILYLQTSLRNTLDDT